LPVAKPQALRPSGFNAKTQRRNEAAARQRHRNISPFRAAKLQYQGSAGAFKKSRGIGERRDIVAPLRLCVEK
jgi:hypothetical protein